MGVSERILSGAGALLSFQLLSRVITFALNQLLLRFIEPSAFGIVHVQLEFFSSMALFIAREPVRNAVSRITADVESRDAAPNNSVELARMKSALNLSWIAMVAGSLILFALKATFDMVQSPEIEPASRSRIIHLYMLGIMLELLAEPLYAYLQMAILISDRVTVDLVATIFKGVTSFVLISHYEYTTITSTVEAFSLSQIVFGTLLVIGYYWKVVNHMRRHNLGTDLLLPGNSIEGSLLNVTRAFLLQNVTKFFLGESDKLLMSVLSNAFNQGIYSLVSN